MTLNNCTVTIEQYVEHQTVGTQYVDKQVVGDERGEMPIESAGEDTDRRFKYISPYVTDEVEREKIHKTVVNLVTSGFRLSAICTQLKELQKTMKIAMYVSTTDQYAELVRLGLPKDKDGYSQKNYENYMSEQKR